jgi:hypothetical protein
MPLAAGATGWRTVLVAGQIPQARDLHSERRQYAHAVPFRFQRRQSLGKGLWVGLSKSEPSLGRRGKRASVSVRRRGPRASLRLFRALSYVFGGRDDPSRRRCRRRRGRRAGRCVRRSWLGERPPVALPPSAHVSERPRDVSLARAALCRPILEQAKLQLQAPRRLRGPHLLLQAPVDTRRPRTLIPVTMRHAPLCRGSAASQARRSCSP